jgi:hypothetical protein
VRVTTNVAPHFGQRIFRPAGGIRFSSTWYGALHPSHSTFTMLVRPRDDAESAGVEHDP